MYKQRNSIDILPIVMAILAFLPVAAGASIWYYGDIFVNLIYSIGKSKNILSLLSIFCEGYSTNYRPLAYFLFALGYRMWGAFNATGFILMIAAIFSLSAFYLYLIGKNLKNQLAGFVAAMAYLSFFPTFSSMWWINNLYDALVLFLGTLTIYQIILWTKGRGQKHLILGIISALLAYLSKPSAMFIGPVIFMLGFFGKDDEVQRKKTMILGIILSVTFALQMVLSRLLPDVAWYSGARLNLTDAWFNLRYYFSLDVKFFGMGLLFLSLFSFKRDWNYRVLALGVVYFVVMYLVNKAWLILSFLPFLFLFFLLCFILGDSKKRFAIAWVFIGLLSALQFSWADYRYQTESCLGLSLLIGLGISDHIAYVKDCWEQRKKSLFILSLSLSFLLLVVGGYRIIQRDIELSNVKIRHLLNYSHNAKETAEYIAHRITPPVRLLIPPASDYTFNSHEFAAALSLYRPQVPQGIHGKGYTMTYFPDEKRLNLVKMNLWLEEHKAPRFDFTHDYLIAGTNFLKKYFEEYKMTNESEESNFLEKEFLNIASREKIKVSIFRKENIRENIDWSMIGAGTTKKPAYIIYKLESPSLIKSLRIITYPRMSTGGHKINRVSGSYSLDSEKYFPIFNYTGNLIIGSGRWEEDIIVTPEVYSNKNVVYLKFEFFSSGQLLSRKKDPTYVIINQEESHGLREGDIFPLFFSSDEVGEKLQVKAIIEKIVTKGGYPVGIVKLERY